VDGDLRNPSISRSLAPGAQIGLLQVVKNEATLDDVLFHDEQSGLKFLPSTGTRPLHTNETLASKSFANLIENLCEMYDYVIVDLPPMAPVVDVRATTQVIDSYIFVVEWGKTRKNLAQNQLFAAAAIHDRLLGAVLNKADVNVLERYEAYYGRNFYKNYYGSSYRDERA
jgi:succinoglycan biosynthesis transport protein ExoP